MVDASTGIPLLESGHVPEHEDGEVTRIWSMSISGLKPQPVATGRWKGSA